MQEITYELSGESHPLKFIITLDADIHPVFTPKIEVWGRRDGYAKRTEGTQYSTKPPEIETSTKRIGLRQVTHLRKLTYTIQLPLVKRPCYISLTVTNLPQGLRQPDEVIPLEQRKIALIDNLAPNWGWEIKNDKVSVEDYAFYTREKHLRLRDTGEFVTWWRLSRLLEALQSDDDYVVKYALSLLKCRENSDAPDLIKWLISIELPSHVQAVEQVIAAFVPQWTAARQVDFIQAFPELLKRAEWSKPIWGTLLTVEKQVSGDTEKDWHAIIKELSQPIAKRMAALKLIAAEACTGDQTSYNILVGCVTGDHDLGIAYDEALSDTALHLLLAFPRDTRFESHRIKSLIYWTQDHHISLATRETILGALNTRFLEISAALGGHHSGNESDYQALLDMNATLFMSNEPPLRNAALNAITAWIAVVSLTFSPEDTPAHKRIAPNRAQIIANVEAMGYEPAARLEAIRLAGALFAPDAVEACLSDDLLTETEAVTTAAGVIAHIGLITPQTLEWMTRGLHQLEARQTVLECLRRVAIHDANAIDELERELNSLLAKSICVWEVVDLIGAYRLWGCWDYSQTTGGDLIKLYRTGNDSQRERLLNAWEQTLYPQFIMDAAQFARERQDRKQLEKIEARITHYPRFKTLRAAIHHALVEQQHQQQERAKLENAAAELMRRHGLTSTASALEDRLDDLYKQTASRVNRLSAELKNIAESGYKPLDTAEAALNNIRHNLAKVRAADDECRVQLENADRDIDGLKKENHRLQRQIDELRRNLRGNIPDDERRRIEAQTAGLEEQQGQNNTRIDQLNAQMKVTTNDQRNLKTSIRQLEQEERAAQQQVRDAENYTPNLRRQQDALESAAHDLQRLSAQLNEINTRIIAAAEQYDETLRQFINESKALNANLKKEAIDRRSEAYQKKKAANDRWSILVNTENPDPTRKTSTRPTPFRPPL